MEDKIPIYMVLVVAIVALVGLVMIISHSAPTTSHTYGTSNVASAPTITITGNVVSDSDMNSFNLNGFGKFFFAIFLMGVAGYMYFRQD